MKSANDGVIDCTFVKDVAELYQTVGEQRKQMFKILMNSVDVRVPMGVVWELLTAAKYASQLSASPPPSPSPGRSRKAPPIPDELRAEALAMIRDGVFWKDIRDKLGIPGSVAFGLWSQNKDKNS